MPYIIVLILVIAIVVVAVRKQKFDQKNAENRRKNDKSQDIYTTAEETKDNNSADND